MPILHNITHTDRQASGNRQPNSKAILLSNVPSRSRASQASTAGGAGSIFTAPLVAVAAAAFITTITRIVGAPSDQVFPDLFDDAAPPWVRIAMGLLSLAVHGASRTHGCLERWQEAGTTIWV